jgi:hypothetical protein
VTARPGRAHQVSRETRTVGGVPERGDRARTDLRVASGLTLSVRLETSGVTGIILHPDHSSDLPGVLWSGRNTRNDVLLIVGPSGNEAAPAFNEFLTRLFDPKNGSWEVLSSVVGPGPGVKLDPRVVDVTRQEPTAVYDRDGIKVTALSIPHGNLPTLAYRVETQEVTVVYSSDQTGTNPRFFREGRGHPRHASGDRTGLNQSHPGSPRRGRKGGAERESEAARIESHREFRSRCGGGGGDEELLGSADYSCRPSVHAGEIVGSMRLAGNVLALI